MHDQTPQREAAVSEDLVKLAAFRVGDQEYAVDIMRIKEIVNPLPITRVPKAPPFIEGMVELRGAILPIMDLRKRFELPPAVSTRATKYINVSIDRQIIGLVVDAVSEVIRIPRQAIRPPPGLLGADDERYLLGVCRHGDRILMILDIDRLLSSSEKVRLAALGHSRAGGATTSTRGEGA